MCVLFTSYNWLYSFQRQLYETSFSNVNKMQIFFFAGAIVLNRCIKLSFHSRSYHEILQHVILPLAILGAELIISSGDKYNFGILN